MPAQTVQNDHPLNARIPQWMADGLAAVAEKKRVKNVSMVTRWAIEDLLKREGITAPETAA